MNIRNWNQPNTRQMITVLSREIHAWAKEKGFYEDAERNTGEMIALMHSELSEALEAYRQGVKRDEHCPDFDNELIEYADCIIRILDTCAYKNYPIGAAIMAKMGFNETRARKHGKAF